MSDEVPPPAWRLPLRCAPARLGQGRIFLQPTRRMREHRATLLARSDADRTKDDEARVHTMLRPWHMAHEWYTPTPAVVRWVLSLPHTVAGEVERWIEEKQL